MFPFSYEKELETLAKEKGYLVPQDLEKALGEDADGDSLALLIADLRKKGIVVKEDDWKKPDSSETSEPEEDEASSDADEEDETDSEDEEDSDSEDNEGEAEDRISSDDDETEDDLDEVTSETDEVPEEKVSLKQDDDDLPQTSLAQYFHEIQQYPLLTKEQEIDLASRIAKGDKEAEDELINSNLRLVASIAKRYRNKIGSSSLTYEDLIAYGNQGLMTAVKKFDASKGCRFSTYASLWIRQSIMRAISLYGRQIKIPVYVSDAVSRIKSIKARLTNELEREPTSEEIARAYGKGMTAKKVDDLLFYEPKMTSLDAPANRDQDDDTTLENKVSAMVEENKDKPLADDSDLEYALSLLPDRERRIVAYRYGLGGENPHTLEEVGQKEGITRERARQILNKAIKSLQKTLVEKH